ncbi:glyoxalase, partial [Acidimicrobiaceae bacterium USS-CC1]|nr:glyoxalase [Acidiferrimicrobium australe]
GSPPLGLPWIIDAVLARALTAGAALERAASDQPYGRQAVFRDPFGHRWMLSGARADVGRRHGDIGYASLNVPDAARAAAFYGAVLGWRYEPAAAGHARQVVGQGLHHGIWGRDGPPTLFLAFAVAGLDAALARVRDAGGTAGPAEDEPYGRIAECRDDQGTRFALLEV